MMKPELEMKRDTVEISNGRKLYNYTFSLEGKPLAPMTAADVVQPPAPEEKGPENEKENA